jgi:hypothetical protein
MPGAPHLRQRAAVRRQRLQRIHSHLRYDACTDVAVLCTIEREDRTLAQIHQSGMYPARSTAVAGGCRKDRGVVGPSLQYRRLHSAIGYIAPLDKLEGREAQIFAERDRKLEEARLKRQQRCQQAKSTPSLGTETWATVN